MFLVLGLPRRVCGGAREEGIVTAMLGEALALAARGFRVFPVDGKLPRVKAWQRHATTDEAQIRAWWAHWPNADIGIAGGREAGIFVVDMDPRNGGEASFAALEGEHGAFPSTYTVMTGGDGAHLYYVYPDDGAPNGWRKEIARGVDIKADGGYVVGPGSLHASGKRYAILDDVPIAPAPAWLLELACKPAPAEKPPKRDVFADAADAPDRPYVGAAVRDEVARVAAATEGTRNDQLNTSAFSLGTLVGAGELERAHAERRLLAAAVKAGLPESEAARTVASGLDAGTAKPRELPTTFRLTDLGNAERFAQDHKDAAIFVHQWNAWLLWNGRTHTRDAQEQIRALGKQTVRNILRQAGQCEDDERRKLLTAHATKSESRAALAAMISLAQSELAGSPDQFDQHRDLLNCANGVVDLRSGELRPHRREDYFTKLTPIEYATAGPKRHRWDQFLREIFRGDEELVGYVKRFVGYSLTGHTREHAFFVLYGGGRNGKGRFIRQLMALLGDAARTTAFGTFTVDREQGSKNTPALAKLCGMRLVVAGEPDEGTRLSESVIKSLTGEDEIEACAKYESPFTFTPQFKIVLHTNHRPEIRGTDLAIWKRPRMIPCLATFDGQDGNPAPDLELDAKLDAERSGILAWAVEGAVEWYRVGLGTCAAVEAATADYRAASDALAPFLEECVQVAEAATFTPNHAIYGVYTRWCTRNGVEPWRADTLSKRLVARGYRPDKHGGVRGFRGVGLRPAEHRSPFAEVRP